MNDKTSRLIALAGMGAALIAGLAYWAIRAECDADPDLRGDVERQTTGKLLYFDGRCWTPEPQPPTDIPF